MGNSREVVCPVCSAEIPLDANETLGVQIFCIYCEIELKLIRDTRSEDPDAMRATEDVD